MEQNSGQTKDPSTPVNLDEQQLRELENMIAGLKKGIMSVSDESAPSVSGAVRQAVPQKEQDFDSLGAKERDSVIDLPVSGRVSVADNPMSRASGAVRQSIPRVRGISLRSTKEWGDSVIGYSPLRFVFADIHNCRTNSIPILSRETRDFVPANPGQSTPLKDRGFCSWVWRLAPAFREYGQLWDTLIMGPLRPTALSGSALRDEKKGLSLSCPSRPKPTVVGAVCMRNQKPKGKSERIPA